MDILNLRTGITPTITVTNNLDPRPNPTHFSAGRPPATALRTALSTFSFKHPFRSLFPMKGVALDDAVSAVEHKESKNRGGGNLEEFEGQNGNWVMKVLHVKSMWSDKGTRGEEENGSLALSGSGSGSTSCGESEVCDCEYEEEEVKEEVGFDRSSFSKLLKKVSLGEAKLYAQMSHLGSLAYDIPKIKSGNLLKRHGFKFVTSSIEKREQLANTDSDQPSSEAEEQETGPTKAGEPEDAENEGPRVSPEAAFQTVASAAAFLNARTRSIFISSKADADQETPEDDIDSIGDMASFIATTDSVTSVVAAKEEVKQAVADDLNSISSSPCEWYICDDDKTATRFFVIQGSETLASWQANLLFEPIQFEGMDIMVHRGIYEAAKGMYQQMLPEIRAHTRAHGARARLRFTGHSLGGSLSLLINLMLLIRGEAPLPSLLPVISFGSPTILCGGDELLRKLGLPRSHVQAVTMHRDIVPRAFSCHYPNHVAEILKAVNGNFRNHRCLNSLKLLYAPMGEMIILQPEATYSPQHHLLPSGSGLYAFTNDADRRLLRSAKLAFLNSPHPLEILSDRSAYGNTGTIQRDHDMSSYLKCVRSVIRHELCQLGRAERERRRDMWRSLILPRVVQGGGVAVGAGRATVKRFSRLVASHHVHLLVLVGGYSVLDSFLF